MLQGSYKLAEDNYNVVNAKYQQGTVSEYDKISAEAVSYTHLDVYKRQVEDIMGPQLFDYGYGPFRWVCLSGKHEEMCIRDRGRTLLKSLITSHGWR